MGVRRASAQRSVGRSVQLSVGLIGRQISNPHLELGTHDDNGLGGREPKSRHRGIEAHILDQLDTPDVSYNTLQAPRSLHTISYLRSPWRSAATSWMVFANTWILWSTCSLRRLVETV